MYRKWKTLNNALSIGTSSKYTIFVKSIKILCFTLYIWLCQWLNKTVVKIGKNTYEINYVLKGKLYKVVVVSKGGASPVLQVIDDLNQDVTKNILMYMGPSYDWHNSHFSPEFFGTQSLTFELIDGSEVIFNAGEHKRLL